MFRPIALLTTVVASLLLVSAVAAQQLAADAFWSSVAADVQVIDDLYGDVLNTNMSDAETIAASAPAAERLRTSLLAYRSRPRFTDPEQEAAAASTVEGLSHFYVGLRDFRAALAAGDHDLAYEAGSRMNVGAGMIDGDVDEAGSVAGPSFGEAMSRVELIELGLFAGTLATALISAAVFVVAKSQPSDEFGRMAESRLMNVFRASLVPFGGFLFSTVTYLLADFGESYYVASGALIFGGVGFFTKAWSFFSEDRPAIDAQRSAERLLDRDGPALLALYRQHPGSEFDLAVTARFDTTFRIAAAIRERLAAFEAANAMSQDSRGFAW